MAKEEVASNRDLQNTLTEIARNKKLTAEQKQEMYEGIYKTYRRYISDLEKKGGKDK